MEVIRVGETRLPSGRAIERLFLVTRAAEPNAGKMLIANDGITVYARQYPHEDAERPDEWDPVGPVELISAQWDAAFGFHRVELEEFLKDA